jgi:hypothetical protein
MYVVPVLPSRSLLTKSLVWSCSKAQGEQCSFFEWVDEHEAAANAQSRTSQLPPVPQTPTKTGASGHEPNTSTVLGSRDQRPAPQSPDTPFTMAKRKRVSGDITNQDNDGDDCNRTKRGNESSLRPTMVLDDPFARPGQPPEHTRKSVKATTLSTPGQPFTERLKSHTVSLPTPDSQGRISASNDTTSESRLPRSPEMSPTPGLFNNRVRGSLPGKPDLTTTVLELIRSDNIELKTSTEMKLRHEIGLESDVTHAKLRRYEETISELRKRVDELETMVLHLTG